MEVVYQVDLMPVEPILLTDNRSARAGEDHLIRDQDPSPHRIYGAIGANLAVKLGATINRDNWKSAEDVLGKFVPEIEKGCENRSELLGYYYSGVNGKSWFPWPRHLQLLKVGEQFQIGSPVQIAHRENNVAFGLDFNYYLASKPDECETEQEIFIGEETLEKVLCGDQDIHDSNLSDFTLAEDLYHPEVRLGLGMDNDRNLVKEGILFSRPYRRFNSAIHKDEWRSASIQAFFKTLKEVNESQLNHRRLAFLGGDRGRVIISYEKVEKKKLFEEMKQSVMANVVESDGFLCYLLTPAVRESQYPDLRKHAAITAAIGRETVISGWNAADRHQHPRPILKLIPEGSVLFYKWDGEEETARKELVEKLWLAPVSESYRNSGFGRMLIGVWK